MCPIMQKNENTTDRVIRLVAGAILLAVGLFVFQGGTMGIIFDILGAVLLFTAATGFCLIYKLFGFSTRK